MEVVVANMRHVHPKIDFLSLQSESNTPESTVHVYLFLGQGISTGQLAECKKQLEVLAPSRVKIYSEQEDFSLVSENVKRIGIILESNISFESVFFEKLLSVFENTDTFLMYSDFLQISNNIQSQVKLPAWSPIRFETVDYLGPVVAFDLGCFSVSSSGAAVSRVNVLDFSQTNDLRISRLPSALFKCKSNFKRMQAKSENLSAPESVSIVVPTQGIASSSDSLLEKCVAGLIGQVGVAGIELIVVVDEGFDEGVVSRVKGKLPSNFSLILVEFNEPFNFSRKCNFGASKATGEVIVFLNDDVELVSTDSIAKLSSWSLQEGVGAVGSQLQFADGSIQHAGITLQDVKPRNSYLDQFPRVTDIGDLEVPHEVSGVTGACLAISKERFDSSGGWNEELPNSYNDVDLCLRLNKKGFQSVVLNQLKIIHNESSSRNAKFDLNAFETLKQLWPDELRGERYLRSAEANGRYFGPWGTHHDERLDFSGNSFAYAWHLISSHGVKRLFFAVLGRMTGKTHRILTITQREYL
jgi:GT2 family glycosyltransferase